MRLNPVSSFQSNVSCSLDYNWLSSILIKCIEVSFYFSSLGFSEILYHLEHEKRKIDHQRNIRKRHVQAFLHVSIAPYGDNKRPRYVSRDTSNNIIRILSLTKKPICRENLYHRSKSRRNINNFFSLRCYDVPSEGQLTIY